MTSRRSEKINSGRDNPLFFQLPVFHAVRLAHLALFVIGSTGAATESPAVHRLIAVGAWVALALAAAALFLPGALAAQQATVIEKRPK